MDAKDSLGQFVDLLLRVKHGNDISASELSAMKADLLTKLNRWITLKILTDLAKISNTAFADFQSFVQKTNPTPEQIQGYIREKIPDQTGLLTQALLEFRSVYIGRT